MKTTVGKLLLQDAVPAEFQAAAAQTLDKKGVSDLLREIAQKAPDRYREISHKLLGVAREVAFSSGANAFGLRHLTKSPSAAKLQEEFKNDFRGILADDTLSDKERNEQIIKRAGQLQEKQTEAVYQDSLKEGNPLAQQILSGARGNKTNLSTLRGSDVLYTDSQDNVLPVPVLRSYSEGLSPSEYWASTYGARKGVVAVKTGVADAGALAKLLNRVSHRLMVVGEDDPDLVKGQLRGMPVDTDDPDNVGALLAKDVGDYKRDTPLTSGMLRRLQGKGIGRIVVRSPIVGGSAEGGIYAKDAGVREYGTLPGIGEQTGLTAAQALSEVLTQSTLGAKHTGGVSGQDKSLSGFKYIEQMISIPKTMKEGGVHAQLDGRVRKISPHPVAGNNLWIDDEPHYIPADRDLNVKLGDEVEAGDMLTDGAPNPAEIVKHKGIGEGRRYFAHAFRKVMRDSGLNAHRRNIEVLARGLINHVQLTDEYGAYSPDDVVPYSTLEKLYRPRVSSEKTPLAKAKGRYLEEPVLHYTLGTLLRPSVLAELGAHGIEEVRTHAEPPPFTPRMIRGNDSLQYDPDPLVRMYGSGLKASLLDAVHFGGTSDPGGTSFVPGLMAATDFGRKGLVRSPQPGLAPPPEGKPFAKMSQDWGTVLKEKIQAAEAKTHTSPTEGQREAGNYKKGKVSIQGLLISIEYPRGSTRSGVGKDGKPWENTMKSAYGYIRRQPKSQADGDHQDVFLGDHPDSQIVFVVDQNKPNGRFDECKSMIGWTNSREAKEAYLANYSAGWTGFGAITPMTMTRFKEWLIDGDTSRPASQWAKQAADWGNTAVGAGLGGLAGAGLGYLRSRTDDEEKRNTGGDMLAGGLLGAGLGAGLGAIKGRPSGQAPLPSSAALNPEASKSPLAVAGPTAAAPAVPPATTAPSTPTAPPQDEITWQEGVGGIAGHQAIATGSNALVEGSVRRAKEVLSPAMRGLLKMPAPAASTALQAAEKAAPSMGLSALRNLSLRQAAKGALKVPFWNAGRFLRGNLIADTALDVLGNSPIGAPRILGGEGWGVQRPSATAADILWKNLAGHFDSQTAPGQDLSLSTLPSRTWENAKFIGRNLLSPRLITNLRGAAHLNENWQQQQAQAAKDAVEVAVAARLKSERLAKMPPAPALAERSQELPELALGNIQTAHRRGEADWAREASKRGLAAGLLDNPAAEVALEQFKERALLAHQIANKMDVQNRPLNEKQLHAMQRRLIGLTTDIRDNTEKMQRGFWGEAGSYLDRLNPFSR